MSEQKTPFFEIRRISDREVSVRFPDGMKVGDDIGFDNLLAALIKFQPEPAEVEGQSIMGCCGQGGGCCVKLLS